MTGKFTVDSEQLTARSKIFLLTVNCSLFACFPALASSGSWGDDGPPPPKKRPAITAIPTPPVQSPVMVPPLPVADLAANDPPQQQTLRGAIHTFMQNPSKRLNFEILGGAQMMPTSG